MNTKLTTCRRTRRFHTRSRAGCLTCRARRKRCSEEKPACLGCRRNFLICTWPKDATGNGLTHEGPPRETCISDIDSPQSKGSSFSEISAPPPGFLELDLSQVSQVEAVDCTASSDSSDSDYSGHSSLLILSPSNYPRTLATPGAQRLYQHFCESTATMLAARPTPQNPFATSLLPLAVTHDYVMHAVLAISGSHYASSRRDDSIYPLAQEHYAVALRSAKHQITRFSRGMCEDPAALVALLLMLCQFECVDGNLHGAVLHHLEAAGEILASIPSNLIGCPESPYRFLIELFIYHNFVSRNMPAGMKMHPPTWALPSLLEIVESSQQHLDGFMFGYAYELYKLIPQIRHLYFARYLDDSPYPAPFEAIRVKLQNWRPPEKTESGWSSTLQVAAHIYQQALFIYLACAEHGPGEADLQLYSSVRPHLDQAMALIELLPSTCPEWTTLSWPLLVVGSCLRDRPRQESLIRTGKRLVQAMYCVPKINKVMQWVWDDETAYGPYGLEKVMLERNVKLSIG